MSQPEIPVGAIRLETLASAWDVTPDAIRKHIYRHHGAAAAHPIHPRHGRVLVDDVDLLHSTFMLRDVS